MTNLIVPAVHPGEYLLAELLEPLGISAYALAQKLHVPRTRIERLVKTETPVTPDTAIRLGKFFKMTPQFWMNMQSSYDLTTTEEQNSAEYSNVEVMYA